MVIRKFKLSTNQTVSLAVISLTGFDAGVTNLNEPPRALAASTITWVRSYYYYYYYYYMR